MTQRFNKVFIVGLPRTGTTSLCVKCLELGFNVAHTAYTQQTFEQAQIIADTPVFNDFVLLDQYYPDSKFILLEREISLWLPSIKQLLNRMSRNLLRTDGGFNPIIKRCYTETFAPFEPELINNDEFLANCYFSHQSKVLSYFGDKPNQLLRLNLTNSDAPQQLANFLNITAPASAFSVINKGGKVTAWNDLKHPSKVPSTRNGKTSPLLYLS
ncbi:sulfotransferase [Thalassotalea marina]|uniref:Sulfotransferase family protein n=1 Tax=Thalassotalea marina TaxID=1673741 RepID=A0A919EN91_9GAMM|nr:sulfotransferase [Thalassotalea marina]GHG03343.1 sulfotransferase family protein [Thalassotalea marina]